MKRISKIPLGILMCVGVAGAIAAPASASISVGPGYYGAPYRPAYNPYCDPGSRYYDPYYCDDHSGYYGPDYYGPVIGFNGFYGGGFRGGFNRGGFHGGGGGGGRR